MGRANASHYAPARCCRVVARIGRPRCGGPAWRRGTRRCRGALDFSVPDAAPGNVVASSGAPLPGVAGTTGWAVACSENPFVRRGRPAAPSSFPNCSLGVRSFNTAVQCVAALLASREGFGAVETRRGAPSFTGMRNVGRPSPSRGHSRDRLHGTRRPRLDARRRPLPRHAHRGFFSTACSPIKRDTDVGARQPRDVRRGLLS